MSNKEKIFTQFEPDKIIEKNTLKCTNQNNEDLLYHKNVLKYKNIFQTMLSINMTSNFLLLLMDKGKLI